MFCSNCGATIPENSQFCNRCGQSVIQTAAQQTVAPTQPAPPIGEVETSGKALASLLTGIFGLLLFPIAIIAIILGHMSRSEIRKSNGRLKGDGMATAGLVMGYGAFAIIPFILIIAAIAIPNLLRARMAANESSAIHLKLCIGPPTGMWVSHAIYLVWAETSHLYHPPSRRNCWRIALLPERCMATGLNSATAPIPKRMGTNTKWWHIPSFAIKRE